MGQDQNSSHNPQQASTDRKPNQGSSNPNPNAKQNPGSPPQGQPTQSANKPHADWNQDPNAGKSPQPQGNVQQNPQQLKTKLKEAFGRLSEDEIALYDSQKDQFFDKLQDKYGLAREEAEDRIHEIEEKAA